MDSRVVDGMTAALSPLADAQPYTTNADDRVYELTNHLGNVLATFTGRKLPLTEADVVVGFTPHVTSLSDYYPFGSGMEGREVDGTYRYGFQGQETDAEYFNGAVSFKYRVHDARLGRFLSIDPLAPDYPWNSTYAFSENRVINSIEFEGLEAWEVTKQWSEVSAEDFGNFVDSELQVLNEGAMNKNPSEFGIHESFDCADLMVHMLSKFAAKEGLRLQMTTYYGSIDSNDPEFESFDDFYIKARKSIGSQHLKVDFVPVFGNTVSGDADFSVAGHVSLIRGFMVNVESDERRLAAGRVLIVSADQNSDGPEPFTSSTPLYDSRFASTTSKTFFRFKPLARMEGLNPIQPAPVQNDELSNERNIKF